MTSILCNLQCRGKRVISLRSIAVAHKLSQNLLKQTKIPKWWFRDYMFREAPARKLKPWMQHT